MPRVKPGKPVTTIPYRPYWQMTPHMYRTATQCGWPERETGRCYFCDLAKEECFKNQEEMRSDGNHA